MNWIDFFIGLFLANSIPHLIMGLTKTRFLGLFGYSPKANIAYASLQIIIGLALAVYEYGFSFSNNGMLLGVLVVVISFLVAGKFLIRFFE